MDIANKVLECVPNISEGRDTARIDRIVDEVRRVPGVALLDVESDADHNRSVITFLGSPEGVVEAALRLTMRAAECIDMTAHRGAHPRMGAADVVPLIPLRGISKTEAVQYARTLGESIWREAQVPVFLYEDAATAPHRVNLADIRRGQFEGMAEKTKLPQWMPDFGAGVHPTAGVTAVGARFPLVAFNINLSTDDVKIAKAIAKVIRKSSGGLDCVKAMGVMLEGRNLAQVSINMTNFNITPLYRVLEMVRFEAHRWGASVVGTQIIGLTPMKALCDSAAYYLQLEDFDFAKQVLENRMP